MKIAKKAASTSLWETKSFKGSNRKTEKWGENIRDLHKTFITNGWIDFLSKVETMERQIAESNYFQWRCWQWIKALNKNESWPVLNFARRRAEWSKALCYGRSDFGFVSSNPTPVNQFVYYGCTFFYKMTKLQRRLQNFSFWNSLHYFMPGN